jgi:hypothetical protein
MLATIRMRTRTTVDITMKSGFLAKACKDRCAEEEEAVTRIGTCATGISTVIAEADRLVVLTERHRSLDRCDYRIPSSKYLLVE